jgi:hypothetical protein
LTDGLKILGFAEDFLLCRWLIAGLLLCCHGFIAAPQGVAGQNRTKFQESTI